MFTDNEIFGIRSDKYGTKTYLCDVHTSKRENRFTDKCIILYFVAIDVWLVDLNKSRLFETDNKLFRIIAAEGREQIGELTVQNYFPSGFTFSAGYIAKILCVTTVESVYTRIKKCSEKKSATLTISPAGDFLIFE